MTTRMSAKKPMPMLIFSGEDSRSMWEQINKAKTSTQLRHALYYVCCRLQMLEAQVVKRKIK